MAGKRELIEPRKGDKRYVRRTKGGTFGEQDDVGRSLTADRRQKAKTTISAGQGDKGDRAARTGSKRAGGRRNTAPRSRAR